MNAEPVKKTHWGWGVGAMGILGLVVLVGKESDQRSPATGPVQALAEPTVVYCTELVLGGWSRYSGQQVTFAAYLGEVQQTGDETTLEFLCGPNAQVRGGLVSLGRAVGYTALSRGSAITVSGEVLGHSVAAGVGIRGSVGTGHASIPENRRPQL